MNAERSQAASRPGSRFFSILSICCLTLALAACAGKTGDKAPGGGKAPVDPNATQAAYGVSMNVPSGWNTAAILDPAGVTKADLDSRRQSGERILLYAATSGPSPKGVESIFTVFLVNEQSTFMPRDVAEKLQPEEFSRLSKDLFEREKATAKKNKAKFNLMDLQLSRDNIGGNFAVATKVLIADPKGVPVRSLRWDVYLPGGAGLAVRAECDPDQPGAETAISNLAKSLRLQ